MEYTDKYQGAMPDSFFRVLSTEEEAQFRQWAREQYKPGGEVNRVWHWVVRDECRKIDQEQLSTQQPEVRSTSDR